MRLSVSWPERGPENTPPFSPRVFHFARLRAAHIVANELLARAVIGDPEYSPFVNRQTARDDGFDFRGYCSIGVEGGDFVFQTNPQFA